MILVNNQTCQHNTCTLQCTGKLLKLFKLITGLRITAAFWESIVLKGCYSGLPICSPNELHLTAGLPLLPSARWLCKYYEVLFDVASGKRG